MTDAESRVRAEDVRTAVEAVLNELVGEQQGAWDDSAKARISALSGLRKIIRNVAMDEDPEIYARAINASLLSHLHGFSDDAWHDEYRTGKAVIGSAIARMAWRLEETLGIRINE